jgi:multimeric flavodoxin WrbA
MIEAVEKSLTKEGKETLDFITNIWSPIMGYRRRDRIARIMQLLMIESGQQKADRTLVIKAARMVLTKGYEPILDRLEDPEKFQLHSRTAYTDMAAYYAKPRIVTRWPVEPTRPAKPPASQKLLAFCASPRRGGNTDLLIDEAIRGAKDSGVKDIEKFNLHYMKLGFCIGCRKCKDPDHTGFCTVKDDMTDIYPKIVASDIIIIGFPIYTGRESAQLSTFLDRWDCFEGFQFGKRLQPGRRAMVIGTWAYAGVDSYDHVMEQIMTILNLHRVTPVEALTACGIGGKLHGWDEKHKAILLRYPEELKKAYEAGSTLATGVK